MHDCVYNSVQVSATEFDPLYRSRFSNGFAWTAADLLQVSDTKPKWLSYSHTSAVNLKGLPDSAYRTET